MHDHPAPKDVLDRLSALAPKLASDLLSDLMTNYSRLYRACFDTGAEFALRPTVAFGPVPEFAVVAMRSTSAGSKLDGMCGLLVRLPGPLSSLSPATLQSVLEDRVVGSPKRLMGPISVVNHRCRTFNAEMRRSGQAGAQSIELWAVRPIHPGEEVTVSYSPHYFGPNNEDCLCSDCEQDGENGWLHKRADRSKVEGIQTRSKARIIETQRLNSIVYTYYVVKTATKYEQRGDYLLTLSSQPSEVCVMEHCKMRFVHLKLGQRCLCCAEQTPYIRTHELVD